MRDLRTRHAVSLQSASQDCKNSHKRHRAATKQFQNRCPEKAAPAERSWRGFRACFASIRTHLACIFSEIFQENTRKSTKDFLRFSFHLSKNLTAQSAYAQMQNRLSQRARSLLSRCPQTAKFPAPCFWRAEKGTKSDSFLRGANKTAPRVKPERKGLIFAMSRWEIANGFPAAQKTACNLL